MFNITTILLSSIFLLLLKYKYLIIFPLAIIEGPILAIIAGLLVHTGQLNILIVYPVIIAGDIIGDSFYYALGRYANHRLSNKIMLWLGLTPARLIKAKIYVDANTFKTISLSKIILGAGISGLFFVGRSMVPYSKFLLACLLTSCVTTAVYIAVGFFFGEAYATILQYLNGFASFTIIALLIVALVIFARSKMRVKQ